MSEESDDTNKSVETSYEPRDDDNKSKYLVGVDDLQCSVCQELFIKPVTLNCSHSFCGFCIERWRLRDNRCPMCRTGIESVNPSMALNNLVKRVRCFFHQGSVALSVIKRIYDN